MLTGLILASIGARDQQQAAILVAAYTQQELEYVLAYARVVVEVLGDEMRLVEQLAASSQANTAAQGHHYEWRQ